MLAEVDTLEQYFSIKLKTDLKSGGSKIVINESKATAETPTQGGSSQKPKLSTEDFDALEASVKKIMAKIPQHLHIYIT